MVKGNQSISVRHENPGSQQGDPAVSPDLPGPSRPSWTGYLIRIRDHLDTYWFEWFDGWEITNLENGEVLLTNRRVDQSVLHGALNRIRDANLTLFSGNCGTPSTQDADKNNKE